MKIELSSIVENQLPLYVREEYPLAAEFLKQYYISDNSDKVVQNLDQYLDLDIFFDIPESTILNEDIDIFDDTIKVSSTKGFPESYGLLKIDEEIITYTSKTDSTFDGCVRGFSGVDTNETNQLVFNNTSAEGHFEGATVYNLSSIFLKDFFFKTKQKIAPGFENREFYSELNQSNFLKKIQDFYTSKGTAESFRILFGALYGKNVELILPRDQLFSASNAQYRITKQLVVESIVGDPSKLINSTIYQDSDGFIEEARGTITYVEKIIRGDKNYYVISLDYDYDKDIDVAGTIKSDFTIHPQTTIINKAPLNSTYLDVDSTVGFPNAGTLVVETLTGSKTITYANKTLNQFLNCIGISNEIPENTPIRLDVFAYGFTADQEKIELRITGVLEDPIFYNNNYSYNPGDKIEIETLGIPSQELKANEWNYNIPLNYNISSISVEDTLTYRINTIDPHVFISGDSASLVSPSGDHIDGFVSTVLNSNSFVLKTFASINLATTYYVRKNLSKTNFENETSLNIYNTNVQNSYVDVDKNVYVLSSSLPSYLNTSLTDNTGIVVLSGTGENVLNIPNHQYFTGDSVVYKKNSNTSSPILDGIYFVKKDTSNTVRLALSRDNIAIGQFIEFSGDLTGSTLEFYDFTDSTLKSKTIQPQNLIRKLVTPRLLEDKSETPLGAIGLLKNGVEILNYKSQQQIFYGEIIDIVPTSPGYNYDLVSPPVLQVSDPVGTGASIYPTIRGNLKRIDLINSGFDYLDIPVISIKGGNGINAAASANLIQIDHVEFFNAESNVDITNNLIGFTTFHKFRQADEVVYNSSNQTPIGGLTDNEKYFISVKSPTTISIHSTKDFALLGINSIDLNLKSIGLHSLKSVDKKNKIGSISILNQGENYEYKKVSISGINTALNIIEAKSHNFKNGEVIYYTTINSVSAGLTNNTKYIVTVVDQDNLQLSSISQTGEADFNYKTKKYISITEQSVSLQYLSYPPIEVEVKGRIGVATFSNEDYNAKVIPIFRGEFIGVTIEDGGSSYGDSEILNYKKQPLITTLKGSGAQLRPIITDGKIISVLIISPGSNYYTQPDIIVNGDGYNAVLVPIVKNGSISEVKVISGGFNYTQEKTTLTFVDPGEGVKFETFIKSRRVNLVERYNATNYFSDDDGVIQTSRNSDGGLQYYHLFASRQLRRSVYAKYLENGVIKYKEDLQLNQNGTEIDSTSHSPIIGWAYDGNPIYGPYGYSSNFNATSIKQIISGYELKSNDVLQNENRPSSEIYPIGFFIEDYVFTGTGDLDEHNGRYCVTPEFPNGTYAYFATVEQTVGQNGFKAPKFPYFIGNDYYSYPIDFNFNPNSNQNQLNLNDLDLLRNTSPYNLTSENTIYQGFIKPYDIRQEFISVKSISPAKIDKIVAISKGDGYKVNEIITLENNNSAKISKISGKPITSIASSVYSLTDVEILTENNEIIGFSTIPHEFENGDIVVLSSYDGKIVQNSLKIESNQLILSSTLDEISNTGIVTYINVYGDISKDVISPTDVYRIENEEVKVLNIDESSSRLRVIRAYNNTSGINSHQIGTVVTEKTRKFKLDNTVSLNSDSINNEYYFNPKENVAIGLSHGVGIVSTIYFSNPGIGETFKIIPTRTVYLPNHELNTNDTIVYNNFGNTSLSISTNGISTSYLPNNMVLYVVRVSNELIGISSNPVGLGSTGTFVGLAGTTGVLYFSSVGLGSYHSFKTIRSTLNADISKQEIVVSISTAHNLNISDKVEIKASSGINTTYKIKYDDNNGRLLTKETTILSVDVENSILEFNQHSFELGEKIIYRKNAQLITGLLDNGFYYVIPVNDTKIKLAQSYYDSLNNINVVITASGDGSLISINPLLKAERNSTLSFDLSDESLSYTQNGAKKSAFQFKLYYDYSRTSPYYNNGKNSSPNFYQIGQLGIDSTATAKLVINEDTPSRLYYDLVPIDNSTNPLTKKLKVTDNEQNNNNTIELKEININKFFGIKKCTENDFTLNLTQQIKPFSYTVGVNSISYNTTSKTATGGIEETSIIKNNPNNYTIPSVISVNSTTGKGAALRVVSNKIGAIKDISLNDIGFEYSVDSTIKPKLNLPKIINTEPLYTIDEIIVSNVPITYYTNPNLVLIDNYSNTVVSDVALNYDYNQNLVVIVKNTQELRGTEPYVIPTNTSVGIAISDISFNTNNKDVTVVLDAGFSDIQDFPFEIGDKVLIENVIVGEEEKGYNSSVYDYALFEIKAVDPKIGGIGATISYSMSDYIGIGETLGTYNGLTLKGSITPEKYFPSFEVKIKKNLFIQGENLYSNGSSGVLIEQNFSNDYIKVLTSEPLYVGNKIVGQSSKTAAIISSITEFESSVNVKSSSKVIEGWKRETGFFNNNLQRLHDNDYYQYFSYSLKSDVNYSKWNEVVSDLVHPAGFKKFSDLVVYSENPYSAGVSTEASVEVFNVTEFTSDLDMNVVDIFDLARENYFYIDNKLNSNEVYFNSKVIQDYVESNSNRVLKIDDFLLDFSLESQLIPYSEIDLYKETDFSYKKYFVSVRDKWEPENTSLTVITTLQNETTAALTQYAELSNNDSLGYFDVDNENSKVSLRFYPSNYEYSSYYINSLSYSIGKNYSGISTLNLGNISAIEYFGATHNVGIGTTTIIGISSSTRAAKLLIGISHTDNSYCEFDELSLVHDGTNIYFTNYGQLRLAESNVGFGTYNLYYSGNEIKVDFTPSVISIGTQYKTSIVTNTLKNTTFSGVGTTSIDNNYIFSSESSTSGIGTELFRYNRNNNGSYSLVCVENTASSKYSIVEFSTMNNEILNEVYYVEYGNVDTNNNLGIISSYIQGNDIIVKFTPSTATSHNIRCLNHIVSGIPSVGNIGINSNFKISSNYDNYEATLFGTKNNFELLHNNLPIFSRSFNAESSAGINITESTIRLPNHYFVTGEEVEYTYDNSPIGIGTTLIGAGTTSILPNKVYIVKVNDLDVKVAASASFALQSTPKTLELTSLGIGTVHTFTSTTQNNRSLICVDNIIQSPIVSTAKTTILESEIGFFDSNLLIQNVEELSAGDLLKIDNEIVKVLSVGVGSTNICLVDRSKLGTELESHSINSLITKINGNYNIIGNNVHYEAPSFVSDENYKYSYLFTGRVFLRSGSLNGSNKTYYDNYIFDDISSQFNGITKSFTLTAEKNNVVNVDDRNAIVLVNNVFQAPQFDYNIIESGGSSTINFTGAATSFTYDVNNASIPRGGIIVSAGSTEGYGYQPLVSAGGTAVVSLAGTIQTVSIGNSGSGYRKDLQLVRVGVQTESTGIPNIQFIGTATVSNGNVVSVAITNPGIGYTSYSIKYNTRTSSTIGIGSTIIPIEIISGIGTNDYVSIGTGITNAIITGIGTTFVTIGSAHTSSISIASNTLTQIKQYNPPKVIFDAPLPYSNISLVYPNGSSGTGVEATVSIVVGQGSSVISFEIINYGYGYKAGEELTVSIGGNVGIPTDTQKVFKPFKIKIDSVYTDQFVSWVVGDLQALDPFDLYFDGVRKNFQLRVSNTPISIQKKAGSSIDLESNLLIFINDVLQVPNESYTFNGGSIVSFIEAPQKTDRSKVVFYKGTSEYDVVDIDIVEEVKIGDSLTLNSEDAEYQQTSRLIYDITSTNSSVTNLYYDTGVSADENLTRPISIRRQTEDIIINGQIVGKDRVYYEPIITPSTQIISNVSTASTEIFVENVKTIFDNKNEYLNSDNQQRKVRILSQDDNNVNYEIINNVYYDGDFGFISGIKTTTIGVGSTGIVFDFYIPLQSPLRKDGYLINSTSGIKTGYYFVVNNTNIGNGIISLESNGTTIGIGTTFIDNTFKAYSVSIAQTSVPGVGTTDVLRVISKVDRFVTGLGYSGYYGDYSWGRLHSFVRNNPTSFNVNPSGINTSAVVQRTKRLKYENYYT